MAQILTILLVVSFLTRLCLSSKHCCLSDVGFETEPCIKYKKQGECIAAKCEWICWLNVAAKKYQFDMDTYNKVETSGDEDQSEDVDPALLEELNKLGDLSQYFASTRILTWDKKGDVEEFKYDETLIKNPTLIDPEYKQVIKQQETDIKAYLTTKKVSAELLPKLTIQILEHKMHKLIAKNEQLIAKHPQLISKTGVKAKGVKGLLTTGGRRRRLSHDPEALTGRNINTKPYSAVGVFGFKKWKSSKNHGAGGWIRSRGCGTIIASLEQGGHYYDYILTAGHNFVTNTVDLAHHDKGVTEAHLDHHPERKFKTDIRFWRAINIDGANNFLPDTDGGAVNPTHPADTMERIWVATNYVNNRPSYLDYAIVKFKRTTQQGETRQRAYVTGSSDAYTRMRLITYRFANLAAHDKFKQRYTPNVVPDHPAEQYQYRVTPYYSRSGMSGSGLFQERANGNLLHYLVGVHIQGWDPVALGPAVGYANGFSIHLRITKGKRTGIEQVISRRWDVAHAHANKLNVQAAVDNNAPAKLAYNNNNYQIYNDYNQYQLDANQFHDLEHNYYDLLADFRYDVAVEKAKLAKTKQLLKLQKKDVLRAQKQMNKARSLTPFHNF